MRLKSELFYCYLVFLIIYSGFILLPAPTPAVLAQYHVSVLGLRLIYLTIILLLAAIWFVGLYGYAKIQTYTNLIKSSKDGKQFAKLTKGVLLLGVWLPVSSTVSAILNYFAMRHLGLLPTTIIINNYINLVFPLLGFIFIGMGARGLSELVRQRPRYGITNALVILIIGLGLVYFRLVATTTNRIDVYHMSIWFILITLVAPYVYMWSVGLLAAYEIYIYRQKVAGIVYKKSLNLLVIGIGWLILTSIIFQYLSTLSAHFRSLSIYWLLGVVYALLLVLSVGFVLIAAGARQLQKIEEV